MGSERISPTAHYTGYTWFRHGLSHPALVTPQGLAMFTASAPVQALMRRLDLPTLEGLLLARHRWIDARLDRAVAAGEIGQIVEIAAGLSPRGWDFKSRHGARITYIEADLPPMAARKRALLEGAGLLTPGHRVVALDALADQGPQSLSALCDTLDPGKGLAIVTEGLLNYFPTGTVTGMWRRFAQTLSRFPRGLYLSDVHLRADNDEVAIRAFVKLLSMFVRGQVHLHFDAVEEAEAQLRAAGFARAELETPAPQIVAGGRMDERSASKVRVILATTGAASR